MALQCGTFPSGTDCCIFGDIWMWPEPGEWSQIVHEADLLKQFRHLSHAMEQARVCVRARRPLFVWLLRTCSEIA